MSTLSYPISLVKWEECIKVHSAARCAHDYIKKCALHMFYRHAKDTNTRNKSVPRALRLSLSTQPIIHSIPVHIRRYNGVLMGQVWISARYPVKCSIAIYIVAIVNKKRAWPNFKSCFTLRELVFCQSDQFVIQRIELSYCSQDS